MALASVPFAADGRQLPFILLLPLAAGLAASAMLPPAAATTVALLVVIILGVPHGALDGEVARPWMQPRFGRAWFAVFALPYLSLSVLVLLAWRLAPMHTLAAFLAVSVWHFGHEDAGPGHMLEALARGGLPVALPVLLHPAATAAVFGTAALVPLAAPPPWLADAALLWIPLVVVATARLLRERQWAVLTEMAGLATAAWALPPLASFALYFVGCHAPRHMASLVADPARAPRVSTMRSAVLRSLPVTGLTLAIGAALWQLYPGAAPNRLLALTLQGLAALTLPHLTLDWLSTSSAQPGARRRTPNPMLATRVPCWRQAGFSPE